LGTIALSGTWGRKYGFFFTFVEGFCAFFCQEAAAPVKVKWKERLN